MTNREKFKSIFGVYAEEFWAYPKDKMLDWLQYDVPDTNVGDMISKASVCEILSDIYPTDGELVVPVADVHKAYDAVLGLPSARRKGKWLFAEYPDGYYHAVCSECGQWADEDVYLKGKWNFCPNCGAEMRQDDPSHPFADDVMMKGEE